MSNTALFSIVGVGIFIVALLFCHAFELSNAYLYYPLACYLGYKISMTGLLYVMPSAFDPPPPPEPKTRLEKKKFAKEAEMEARRKERLAKLEAAANRKLAEARERD